ncbi:hypothetical protein CR513_28286, partial [Mucuna pruriens]
MAHFPIECQIDILAWRFGGAVMQSAARIFIFQKKYMLEILDRFQMKNCNSVSTPTEVGLKLVRDPEGRKVDNTLYKQIVGSLMYLTVTRPDITHVVSLISRSMECPREIHLLAAKRIFRYLQGTVGYGLFYRKGEKTNLIGFTDSDYAGDQDDRKSTSGYVFMIGSGAVSWSSKKQPIVPNSAYPRRVSKQKQERRVPATNLLVRVYSAPLDTETESELVQFPLKRNKLIRRHRN